MTFSLQFYANLSVAIFGQKSRSPTRNNANIESRVLQQRSRIYMLADDVYTKSDEMVLQNLNVNGKYSSFLHIERKEKSEYKALSRHCY